MAPKVIRNAAALALLTMSSCSDHGPYLDYPFVCTGGLPAPRGQCAAAPNDRTASLLVCGDLTADNTLTVSASVQAGAALWVRDTATTRAPLTVEGNYWSGTNRPNNTQSITGTTLTGQSLTCPAFVRSQVRAWDALDLTIPTDVTFGWCDYGHTSLDVNNTLDIAVDADATLTITGDLHIAAPVRINVAAGVTFVLEVDGALDVDNTFSITGGSVHQTTVRVAGPIRIAAPTELHGSLFAPGSPVDANNTLTVDGAAYVGPLRVSAPMIVRGETAFSEPGCATLAGAP